LSEYVFPRPLGSLYLRFPVRSLVAYLRSNPNAWHIESMNAVFLDLLFSCAYARLCVPTYSIVVLRDILISGIRMVAANKNVVIAADIFGKVKSFFLDLASMILILYIGLTAVTSCNFLKYIQVFGLSLMIIGVALTVVSCVNYTVQAIKKLTAQEVELTTADDKDDE